MGEALAAKSGLRIDSETTGKPMKGFKQGSALARILKDSLSRRGVQRPEVLLRIQCKIWRGKLIAPPTLNLCYGFWSTQTLGTFFF